MCHETLSELIHNNSDYDKNSTSTLLLHTRVQGVFGIFLTDLVNENKVDEWNRTIILRFPNVGH